MIDSAVLGAVVGECAAGSAELVVEGDGGGEGEQALQDALRETLEGSCSVALEGERALAGPEDALDALADRGEVWSSAGLVLATGPQDRGVQIADGLCECSPGVALVADQRLTAGSAGAPEQFQGDVALVAFWARRRSQLWVCRRGRRCRAGESPRRIGCGCGSSRSRRRRPARSA
jgi:hypothetical protein